MTAYDIDKSGRLVRNSPRAGAGRGRSSSAITTVPGAILDPKSVAPTRSTPTETTQASP